MSFRELLLRDQLGMMIEEKPLLQSMVEAHSPIMKLWFLLMTVNLAFFLFILH